VTGNAAVPCHRGPWAYHRFVDPAYANALGILETFRRLPRERHPVVLDAVYLRAVERLEELPSNCSGADKSWVEESRREFRDYFARAQRAPHFR
jgi:hypothetical protein